MNQYAIVSLGLWCALGCASETPSLPPNPGGTGGGAAAGATNGGVTSGGAGTSTGSTQAGGAASSGSSQGTSGGSTNGGGSGGANSGSGGGSLGGTVSSGGSTSGSTSAGGQTTGGGSGGVTSGGSGGGVTSGGSGGGVSSGGSGGSAGAIATGCPRACGPTYDQFFDNKKLATLRITIDAADLPGYTTATWLDALWAKWKHCSPFSWVNSTVQYESPDGVGNVTMSKVGMRLRGSMPRGTNQIQGFKLDLQTLDTAGAAGKRRFADLNRLNLLSVEADPSHLVQCLAYKMMRDSGIPAPRCSHLKVYVNGQYYGLMESVEQVNKGYDRRHFGTNAGSLYGASPSMADCPSPNGFQDSKALLTYSGDAFSGYTSQYQLTHATATEAEQNLIPMLKCGDATATPDDATFKTCMAQWMDVDEWLREIAAESIMPSLETMIGYYRNYYLYFKQDTAAPHGGRFVVWSWDVDSTFHHQKCNTSTCDILTGVSNFYGIKPRAKLIQRLTTVFRPQYCTALNDFLKVYKASAVDEMANVLTAAFTNEPSVTASAWQAELTVLKNHITSRATAVQSQITAACQ